MLKALHELILPKPIKNIKKVLGILDQKLVDNGKNSDLAIDIALTASDLQSMSGLTEQELKYVIATLKSNNEIKSVYLQGSHIAHHYILEAGIFSHYTDRYGEKGIDTLTKMWQFYFQIVVIILVALIPHFLNKADTKSLESQVSRQQVQIDSLKKALEPKALLKPAPPYRK